MKIDAHQHFWRIARAADYPWMTPELGPLYRDRTPADLAPLLARHGIAATLLVQASPTVQETRDLLALARATPFVRGVVGWCEFADANAPSVIAEFAADPLLVGLRPMVQDIADDDWLLRADLAPAFGAMQRQGLVFDALVHPRHLPRLAVVIDTHPALPVVVDHGAKPAIGAGSLIAWRRDIAAIAAREHTVCKVSGLVTECGGDWSIERLRPVVDHLLDCFGPQRLIWGSDWPVVDLAGGYDDWHASAQTLLAGLDAAQRDAVFGGNAQRVYLGHRGRP